MRSKQFHGKVTDEDLALALLARSQTGTAATGVLQSSLQVEQLVSLVHAAQQKVQSTQSGATGPGKQISKVAKHAAQMAVNGPLQEPPLPKNANTVTILQKSAAQPFATTQQ